MNQQQHQHQVLPQQNFQNQMQINQQHQLQLNYKIAMNEYNENTANLEKAKEGKVAHVLFNCYQNTLDKLSQQTGTEIRHLMGFIEPILTKCDNPTMLKAKNEIAAFCTTQPTIEFFMNLLVVLASDLNITPADKVSLLYLLSDWVYHL